MLKNELDKHYIEFQILNLDAKIPTLSSIILTTTEDIDKLKVRNHNNYLVYSKSHDFKKYIIKVIAAFRIGYKKYYSRLTFSIDPGKKSGLMIFLDDYYLNSYCCFEISEIITIIKHYFETFQDGFSDSFSSQSTCVKLKLQCTVKIEPQSVLACFTHWVLPYQMVETGLNGLHGLYTIKFNSICHPLLGKSGLKVSDKCIRINR